VLREDTGIRKRRRLEPRENLSQERKQKSRG